MNNFNLAGKFRIQHFRHGVLKQTFEQKNRVVDVGLTEILNVMFDGLATTTWYLGLIDSAGFTSIAASDTMASHAGWSEETTYSEGTRQTWPNDPAVAKVIKNPIGTLATFTMTGSVALQGAFLTNDNVKGGVAGTLWSASTFVQGVLNVIATDVVRIQYILEASNS